MGWGKRLTDVGAQQPLAELGAVACGRRAGLCKKRCFAMVAMAKTLDGPSHTPGAEEEMLGQAVGLVGQAGLK